MAFSEIKKGHYYRFIYQNYKIIIKSSESGTKLGAGIGPREYGRYDDYWKNGNFGAANDVEEASDIEIQWLDACIKAGKFVKNQKK